MSDKINVPIRGMMLDRYPTDVEPDSYSYALNAIVEDVTGNLFKLANEHGNVEHLSLEGHSFLGNIPVNREENVIFSKTDSYSEIGLLNISGEYELLIRSSELAFSDKIKGEFKIKNGCETIVIFNDYNNPDRLVNISRLELYTVGGITPEEANESDLWDVNEMRLQPLAQLPAVELSSVLSSGGFLYPGTYAFQLEYTDDAGNSLYKTPLSTTVPIYSGNLPYEDTFGNFSDEVRSNEDGGIPLINKSISLRFVNLDTRFNNVRLNVLYFKTGDGITRAAHAVGNLISYNTSEINYIYTGFNVTRGDYQIDPSEINVFPLIYESSFTLTQIDNRLARANLKSPFRDYSTYQRIVNNITTTPVVKTIKAKDSTVHGNGVNPFTYWNTRSLQADEIYAPSIVFLHNTGELSPAFIIPGREKIDIDEQIVSRASFNVDVQHLPYKPEYEYWEVYNTGNRERMGYYEGLTSYPLTKDCNDEYVWGALAGTPIRYHKMPCRKSIPLIEDPGNFGDAIYINLLGIEFQNVTYPDDSIIGHFFCIARRDEPTVLDSGFLNGYELDADDRYNFSNWLYGVNTNDPVVQFISPKSMLGQYQNGNHFKVLAAIAQKNGDQPPEEHGDREYPDADSNGEFEIKTQYKSFGYSWQDENAVYRHYTDNVLIEKQSIYEGGNFEKPVYNSSFSNDINVFRLGFDMPRKTSLYYAAHKIYVRPYENIYNLVFLPMHSNILTESSTQVFGGDIFIAPMNIFNITSVRDVVRFLETDKNVDAQFLFDMFVESTVNWDLITSGLPPNDRFAGTAQVYHPYLITKVADQTEDGQWRYKGYTEPEFYSYNQDYSVVNSLTEFFILPRIYNYCSACKEIYPNRIVWSPVDLDDASTESYRINLNEDYVIVGAHTGQITALHYDKNRLLVRTNQSMFQLAPNPQVLQTDIDSAYLGTGDFLGIPPNELVKTSYGFAGGQGRFDYCTSEYGFITADVRAGQIFLFSSNNPEVLTGPEYGVEKWFSDNLPGTDTQLVFDPYFNRLIVLGSSTLSFSFTQRGWTSFHRYTAEHAFADVNYLYLCKDTTIWKSDYYLYQTYFGSKEDFIIEYVISTPITSDMDCLHYYAQTLLRDNGKWKDKKLPTFDRFMIYTDSQSTGLQTLNQRDKHEQPWNSVWDNRIKDVIYAEQNYRICQIRDLAIAEDIDDIDYDRIQWHLIPIKDKFFRVRLYFKPDDNYKKIFNLSLSSLRESIL